MASEIYLALKLAAAKEDVVAGDVQAAGHEGQIDVDEWSWKAKLIDALAESGKAHRAEGDPLTLKKRFDRSSTILMRAASKQTVFPQAVITMRQRADHKLKLTVALETVRIRTYELTVTDTASAVTMEETLTLSFDVIRIKYAGRDLARTAASTSRPAVGQQATAGKASRPMTEFAMTSSGEKV
jgi:type VI secretion system Hcp family effector